MLKSPTFPDCFDELKRMTITELKPFGYLRPNGRITIPFGWTLSGLIIYRVPLEMHN